MSIGRPRALKFRKLEERTDPASGIETVYLSAFNPLSRREQQIRFPRSFRGGELPLAEQLVRKLLLRGFDFETPRTFLCPIDGGLGDTIVALEVISALRAHPALRGKGPFRWIGVMEDSAATLYARLCADLGTFDRLLSQTDYEGFELEGSFELLDAMKGGTKIPAHVAMGSAWDYLWASWGVPGAFVAHGETHRRRKLRRVLAGEYETLRVARRLPRAGRYVVICPEAISVSQWKSWTAAGWRALIARILKETTLDVVVCSSKKMFRRIANGLERRHLVSPLSDPTLVDDILPVAALLSQARAVVSVDTGTAQLSGLLQTPCVVLWGPTPPQIYGHRDNVNLRVSSCPSCWCSPRMRLCIDNVCMKEHSPALIWEVLEAALRTPRARAR
jgi:hypothetical protein